MYMKCPYCGAEGQYPDWDDTDTCNDITLTNCARYTCDSCGTEWRTIRTYQVIKEETIIED